MDYARFKKNLTSIGYLLYYEGPLMGLLGAEGVPYLIIWENHDATQNFWLLMETTDDAFCDFYRGRTSTIAYMNSGKAFYRTSVKADDQFYEFVDFEELSGLPLDTWTYKEDDFYDEQMCDEAHKIEEYLLPIERKRKLMEILAQP